MKPDGKMWLADRINAGGYALRMYTTSHDKLPYRINGHDVISSPVPEFTLLEVMPEEDVTGVKVARISDVLANKL